MALTDDDVRVILKLLDASAFGELELETDQFRLTLRRTAAGGWTQEINTLKAAATLQPAAPMSAATPRIADVETATVSAAQNTGLIDVRTPLPGTFYRSRKPGSPPFVQVGDRVDTDTVVAIVETMKLMNSVYACGCGRIAQLCLGDAEFVAQDTVLMRIDPDAA
jgi:acetyl-CoA carboxylase biotin carboxyl carrier protein